MSQPSAYLDKLTGSFTSLLRWPQFDDFWQDLRTSTSADWYVYRIGTTPPQSPATPEQWLAELDAIENELKDKHEEDYCGIVYVDNKAAPSFIKIYHPDHLGVVCGISRETVLPGWTLSKLPPVELSQALLSPAPVKTAWWKKLFA